MSGSDQLRSRFFVLRLIIAALVFGVLSFAGVAIFLNLRGDDFLSDPEPGFARLLLLVLAIFGLGMATAYPLVRRQLTRKLQQTRRGGGVPAAADPALYEGFQTLTIVGAAMAEAFSLFSIVVYLLTAMPLALVGAALGLAAIIRFLPGTERFNSFADEVSGRG